MRQINVSLLLAMLVIALASARARASVIVGGSDLLTAAYVDQLEAWLGQGPITLTNIFDYQYTPSPPGTFFDLATPFHAAADGKGRTFTVMRVIEADFGSGSTLIDEIIGGYNPQSWSSIGDYNYTFLDEEAAAFLFNLTTGEKQEQKLPSADLLGVYQTYNHPASGPAFGYAARDLYVQGLLGLGGVFGDGWVLQYSYGPGFGDNILSVGTGSAQLMLLSDLEVFTISPTSVAASVPEPGSLALVGFGLTAIVGSRAARRRRKGS